jgi:hypothetical protein
VCFVPAGSIEVVTRPPMGKCSNNTTDALTDPFYERPYTRSKEREAFPYHAYTDQMMVPVSAGVQASPGDPT